MSQSSFLVLYPCVFVVQRHGDHLELHLSFRRQRQMFLRDRYRIGHARRLIDEGQTRDKTLEAIGLESGFTSRSSFIIAFREMTGKLPSAYLEELQKSRAGQPEAHMP